jgi:DNA ligase 1
MFRMYYRELAALYAKLEATSKRLEKTELVATFLKKCKDEELEQVMYLLQGRVFSQADERKLGMSSKLLVKSVIQSTGASKESVEMLWIDKGDLGLAVELLSKDKKQSTLFSKELTLDKVFQNIRKIATLEGNGTVQKKVGLVSELLSSATPIEAKYIVRSVAEVLRVGAGASVLRDALLQAFYPDYKELKEEREEYKKVLEKLQHAIDITNDLGVIARAFKNKGIEGIESIELKVGTPVKVMLYPKAKGVEDGFESVGSPAVIEPKLDGFRVQIHVSKSSVKLFTRRLDEVTAQFPDVVKAVRDCVRSTDVILDSEVVGIDSQTKRMVPFQKISQRIKRKHGIDAMIKSQPVVVYVFDVIELHKENMINKPLNERREKLKAIISVKKNILVLIDQLITKDLTKALKYYQECLDLGLEGVMMKKVDGVYKPGKRVGDGVKVKPVMEPLDLVVVGAEWGEGKRANWLSSFIVACKDGDSFLEIGKVGTGIKEKTEEGVSFEELTSQLKPLIIEQKGKRVKVTPKVVLELLYEEIQKSSSYSSGYALRFPRVHRLREDKPLSEINSLSDIKREYNSQKGKNRS